MRRSLLLAGLAGSLAISSSAFADSADLDRCRFVGELSKADQSIAACDRALNDPTLTGSVRAVALSNRCGWWWAKKDPDRALPDCNEAIRMSGGYSAAYVNRGNIYLSKTEPDRAFGDFDEAVRLDPKNAWALSARGNLYKNKGDFEHALTDLSAAIRLDPNYAMARFFRGDLYKSHGDLDRALIDVNESIRTRSQFCRGLFHARLGVLPRGQQRRCPGGLHEINPARCGRCGILLQPGCRVLCHRRSHRGCGSRFQESERTRSRKRLCRALARSCGTPQRRRKSSRAKRKATGHDRLARPDRPAIPGANER